MNYIKIELILSNEEVDQLHNILLNIRISDNSVDALRLLNRIDYLIYEAKRKQSWEEERR